MILFDYSKRKSPSEGTIYISILASFAFLSIGGSSTLEILVFGLIATILSTIRGGNITGNTVTFLTVWLISIFMTFASIVIYDINYIPNIVVNTVFFIIISLIVLLPLYSLGYTQSRREELVTVENKLTKNIGRNIIIASCIITGFTLFINFINGTSTIDLLTDYLAGFTLMQKNRGDFVRGAVTYSFLIVIPCIIITFFYNINKRSNLLSTFVFINLLANPVIVVSVSHTLSINYDILILIFPSVMLVTLFTINEIAKRVPSLH